MTQSNTKSIMTTDLLRVQESTPLEEAYALLHSHWIRHLPVVDHQDMVVGIISERDFERAKITGVGPTVESRLRVRFPLEAKVGDYMVDHFFAISVDDDLRNTIDIMLVNKVSSCLVTKNKVLVGIITTDDLLRLLKTYLDAPHESLREQLEAKLKTSPLGVMGDILSNTGV